MGLSNMLGSAGLKGVAEQEHKNLGDRVGDYFKNRFPIASGLAGAVGIGGNNTPAAPMPTMAVAPDMPSMMPEVPMPQTDFLGLNAKPKQGGGMALLKALFA